MAIVFASRLFRDIRGVATRVFVVCALLGFGVSEAKADFIGYYAPVNFTLTNTGGGVSEDTGLPTANGNAIFPDLITLVLTGTNDGSGIPGATDFTIPAMASGTFQFNYIFSTLDIPEVQYAGYLVGGSFFPLADVNGMFGSVSVPVSAGELIGWRAGGDGQGGLPGVLTITDFSAPVPEPGTLGLLLVAVGVAGAGRLYSQRLRNKRS